MSLHSRELLKAQDGQVNMFIWAMVNKINDDALVRLIYCSSFVRSLSRDDVIELNALSRIRTVADGITGILAFDYENCLELIEGGLGRVNDFLAWRMGESFKTQLSVIDYSYIAITMFSDWRMIFAEPSFNDMEATQQVITTINNFSGASPDEALIYLDLLGGHLSVDGRARSAR